MILSRVFVGLRKEASHLQARTAAYFGGGGHGGSGGRLLVHFPAAAFAQYPFPGRGICNFRQVLARATSDTPYSGANFPIGCDQTCSYSFSRLNRASSR